VSETSKMPPREGSLASVNKRYFREQLFAREYLLDFNGTRAAIAAGFSAKTAAQAASRMLRKVKVRALLAQLLGQLLGRP
jgi:phage terminase small subunit